MTVYPRNESLQNEMLPVEIVLSPSWWHRHEGLTFDEDFFYHPARRVADERRMERALFDRWGRYGLGADHDKDLPVIGPVHLAAGYLLSEMLGCEIEYHEDAPPTVKPAQRESLALSPDVALSSPAYLRIESLAETLRGRYGRVVGDINWEGILSIALDVRGKAFFLDLYDRPEEADRFLAGIAQVIERFTEAMAARSGTTSISVNRTIRHFGRPVFLHSECSHVMVSGDVYAKHLAAFDRKWSEVYWPFGIHYCGSDPHRYAEAFARLPHLDFLDVGWGGNVAALRACLPQTFLNVRLSPVEIVHQTPDDIRRVVRQLVSASANPWLTGVCCINMDAQVRDEQITALLEEVEVLRAEYASVGAQIRNSKSEARNKPE